MFSHAASRDLAAVAPILGVRAASCLIFIRSIQSVIVVPCSPRISLISAWLGLTNGLNDPVARKDTVCNSRGDVPGIDFTLVFRPPLGLVFRYLSYLPGSITRGMFRLCGESVKLS